MMTDTDEALPLGTDVHGRYRTLAIVGRGGVGTVYRVRDIQTGETFALKELANPSASARKQFENEAQWLQALNHPNIPKVREYFEWGARVYLVMAFVEGDNLEQKLSRQGGRPLPQAQVLAWTLPICNALFYLHSQRPPILHRDVKPANIIVTPEGHPVLVDLGIAKEHLPGAGQTATFVKKAGTEGYAPPEQYTSAGKTGPWSDVYGMGATLYELLTGTLPPTAVERVALDSPLLRPRTINPTLSVEIDEVVMRALALRPSDRFQSMLDLARALSAAGASNPGLGSGLNSAPRSGALDAGGAYAGGYNASGYAAGAFGPSGAIPFPAEMPSSPSSSYSGLALPPDTMDAPTSPVVASLPSLDPPERLASSPMLPFTPSSPGATRSSSYPSRGAVLPPAGDDVPAAEVRRSPATAPVDTAESAQRPRARGAPWMAGIIAVLVLLALAAGVLVVVTLGPLAPPDRSTPQASVNGYFAALTTRDYSRAWQYLADSRNAPSAQSADTAGLQADDNRYGKVLSANITALSQATVGSAQATVAVRRSDAPGTTMTYALVLTLYDGQTWLIESVDNS